MLSSIKVDKDLQNAVGQAILQQKPYVILNNEAKHNDVRIAIRIFMRRHPEVFWFSHQYKLDEVTHTLYFKYNFTPKKKVFYAGEIGKAVDHLFQPNKLKHLSDLEKVAYVYKWLVNNTTYNEYSSFNQTIYSVLINRNSVCTGYAKTAQYLLGMIGIQSELVFGKFHADKSDGGRHGWNIVKIDSDWYHVDFCLADPALKHLHNSDETPIERDGVLWNYFCTPTEYVLKNRSIEFVDSYPECVKSIDKRFTIKLATAQGQTVVCKSDSGTSAKVYIDSFDKNSIIKKARNTPHLIDNEVMMLQRLKGCKHIVQLKGRANDGIVLEQLTPWSELLNSHYYHPNEAQLRNILIQLTEGLIECYDNGITYSDIHYNNVFVSKDGTYKWGDFGIAYQSTTDGHLPHQLYGADGVALGSRWFMPPETYREGIFTQSSAIYPLAMLAYFVMNDMRPPFLSNNVSEQYALHERLTGMPIPLPVCSPVFSSLAKLICDVLNADISARPDTFESFVTVLKSGRFINAVGSESCIDIDTNHDLDLTLNDSDVYAQTSRELCFCESSENDSTPFPESSVSFTGPNHWNEKFNQDTDSFARTKGSSPSPVPDAISYIPTSTPVNETCSADKTNSFYPVKDNLKSNKKSSRKSFGIGSLLDSALNIVGKLFSGATASATTGAEDTVNNAEETDDINTCLFAPSEVLLNKSFIIRVYMYLPYEQYIINYKVKEIDPKAVKKEYKPLDFPVKNGDKLTVQLKLSDGVECKSTIKTVAWRGHYTDCSFLAKLIDSTQESIEGTAYVFVNDVPAGEMVFTIDVVDIKSQDLYTKVESRRFSKIFISYAHQDESQVRGIAEGCRMLGKDYFFDRHSLQPGDIFKDKILNYIENADLFVLCWSKNAAESEWVQIEREHALRLIHEGKSSLSIYPLCLRPEAPLPIDMSKKYNFGTLQA